MCRPVYSLTTPTLRIYHLMSKHETSRSNGASYLQRTHWDARYHAVDELRPPAELLRSWIDRLTPGRALDLACGTGRNALLLAERGWQVVGVDLSPVGLHRAQNEARRHNLPLDLLAVDLQAWRWPLGRFDLISVFRFLDRSLCSHIVAALRPGGVLIYETFTVAQRGYEGGPRSDAMLLQPDELPTLFPALDVLAYAEGVFIEDDRPRALAQLVARRPT